MSLMTPAMTEDGGSPTEAGRSDAHSTRRTRQNSTCKSGQKRPGTPADGDTMCCPSTSSLQPIHSLSHAAARHDRHIACGVRKVESGAYAGLRRSGRGPARALARRRAQLWAGAAGTSPGPLRRALALPRLCAARHHQPPRRGRGDRAPTFRWDPSARRSGDLDAHAMALPGTLLACVRHWPGRRPVAAAVTTRGEWARSAHCDPMQSGRCSSCLRPTLLLRRGAAPPLRKKLRQSLNSGRRLATALFWSVTYRGMPFS